MKQFSEAGVSFRYPANWKLEREETADAWSVLVQSPATTFLMLTCDPGLPTPAEMAETALEALRSEYQDLEAESQIETLAGQMALGYDVWFFSLDLTNTCWIRCFYCEAGTVLVLCQSSDLDLETNEPVLRAICASLRVEEG
jgi:hypothetical protein